MQPDILISSCSSLNFIIIENSETDFNQAYQNLTRLNLHLLILKLDFVTADRLQNEMALVYFTACRGKNSPLLGLKEDLYVCLHASQSHLDGVGERESDSERQALGHGDHEHGHTDDQMLDQVVDVGRLPLLPFDHERVHAEVDHQDDHGEDGDGRAGVTDLLTDVSQITVILGKLENGQPIYLF